MNLYRSLEAATQDYPQNQVAIGHPGIFSVYQWNGRQYSFSFYVGPVGFYGWTREGIQAILDRPTRYM